MSQTMYLVIRRAVDRDGEVCGDQERNDTGSRVPLRLFASHAAADAFIAKLSSEAIRSMNPFHLLSVDLTESSLKQLSGLSLPVDCPDDTWHEEWRIWWDLCQDLITDDQRVTVWTILGSVPSYEVLTIGVEA